MLKGFSQRRMASVIATSVTGVLTGAVTRIPFKYMVQIHSARLSNIIHMSVELVSCEGRCKTSILLLPM